MSLTWIKNNWRVREGANDEFVWTNKKAVPKRLFLRTEDMHKRIWLFVFSRLGVSSLAWGEKREFFSRSMLARECKESKVRNLKLTKVAKVAKKIFCLWCSKLKSASLYYIFSFWKSSCSCGWEEIFLKWQAILNYSSAFVCFTHNFSCPDQQDPIVTCEQWGW